MIVISRLAADFALTEGSSLNPYCALAVTLRKIVKDKHVEKNKDHKWRSKMLNFWNHRSRITSVTIISQRSSKKNPDKVTITIYRQNVHSVTHYIENVDIYGYYEWLEIRDALQKE